MNTLLFYILGSLICILISIIWKYYIFKRPFRKLDLIDMIIVGFLSWFLILACLMATLVFVVLIVIGIVIQKLKI